MKNVVNNQAVLNGNKEEVIEKLLNLKNSKIFEDEQSFVDKIIKFIQATVAEETGYITVSIDALNGKVDQVLVGIQDLKDGFTGQFKLVNERLDGVDKRLESLDTRLKSVEEDTKLIRNLAKGTRKVKRFIFD